MEGALSWTTGLLVVRVLALALVLSVLWAFIDPLWRQSRYKRLYKAVRKRIDFAVNQIGAGTSPVVAHKALAADLAKILGPLMQLLAGLSPTAPFIQHLISIADPNAPLRRLDLELLQVKYCFANDCDHLKTPFDHKILITGSAANNANHNITTIQQPGIEPVPPPGAAAVSIPGVVSATGLPIVAGETQSLSAPEKRPFPIIVGQSQAFVDVEIQDMDPNTRIICDCAKSKGSIDLKELTLPKLAAVAPGPGPGPVLHGPLAPALILGFKSWPGLRRRDPNDLEFARFYSKAISDLNGSWIEVDVVNFLKRLHKTMHSY